MIASGGVASLDDIQAPQGSGAAARRGDLGRALYDGQAGSGRRDRPCWQESGGCMLKVRIIPCLDVKDGRVVKGVNFVALRDAGDPVEQAARL